MIMSDLLTLVGSEPTYEGLKLLDTLFSSLINLVPSLPMRD